MSLSFCLPISLPAFLTSFSRVFLLGARRSAVLLLTLSAVVLGGCAGTDMKKYLHGDPFEGGNRAFFRVNQVLDRAILKPGAKTYRYLVPPFIRWRLRNISANLAFPRNFANNIMQGKWTRASIVLARFTINSTLGLGGIFDTAVLFGLKPYPEDFGQTLGVWGVGEGPYLYAPGLGSSTVRSWAGFAFDTLTNPLTWITYMVPVYVEDPYSYSSIGRAATGALGGREIALNFTETLERDSLDYYITLRNLYLQRRRSLVNDGRSNIEDLPDLDELFEDEE